MPGNVGAAPVSPLSCSAHDASSPPFPGPQIDLAKELFAKAKAKGVKILLPTDVVVADAFKASLRILCMVIQLHSLGGVDGNR